ncbi:hypothetical protein EV1_003871 [Malus domestica]
MPTTTIHEAQRDGKMSNFAPTEHHHHGSNEDYSGSGEWANSTVVRLPGYGPRGESHGGTPACCNFSSPGPKPRPRR